MKRTISLFLAALLIMAAAIGTSTSVSAAGLRGANDNAAAALSVGAVSKNRYTARVTANDGLNLRKTMSIETGNVIVVIPKGKIVTIRSRESDNWFKVIYNGNTGYVKGGYLEDNPNLMKTTAPLNLRTQMDTGSSSNIITEMPKGSVVEVISALKDNWYLVNYKGKNGYAKGGYLEKTDSTSGKSIDLKGVTFKDVTVVYDGKEHKLPTVSNLPDGVKVTYSSTKKHKKLGEYEVTATFSAKNSGDTLVNASPKTASLIISVKKGTGYIIGGVKYKVTKVNLKGKGKLTVYGPKQTSLTALTIPDTVKIGGVPFQVTAIAAGSFQKCTKLKEVRIGAKVSGIGAKAFSGCKKLKTVTIGKGLTNIGKQTFQGCKKLTKITIKSKKLKKVGKNALKGINEFAVIEVPAAKVKAYTKLFKKKGQGDLVSIQK